MAARGGHEATVERRERLVEIARTLPEVTVSAAGAQHLAFRVRRRTFAFYLNDHHGDCKVALCFKAPLGEQEALVGLAPERFYVPAYLGSKGWVSLRLDRRRVNWPEVGELLREAYRGVAPKSLAALLG
jgi:hypothetical protein